MRPGHPHLLLALMLATLLSAPCQAIDIETRPRLEQFIGTMQKKHDFSEQELTQWFDATELRMDIIDIMNRPAEALPWNKYRERFATQVNANRGKRFWEKNQKALKRATRKYGVPPEVILAIIGVETRFGLSKGRFRIIDALTTLSLEHPARHGFFQSELEHFLLLARKLGQNPLDFKGSYAGAMGYPQFLPSSYLNYAVDFDRDRKVDLIGSSSDAIGSVGNYLKVHGWKKNGLITIDAVVSGPLHRWFDNMDLKPKLGLNHFRDYGIVPKEHTTDKSLATLIRLEGESGPLYRFGFNNFYVITRYNRSTNYAMAVVELSRMIRNNIDSVATKSK